MFENFSLWPEGASSVARDIDALYLFLIAISVFFVTLIVAALLVFSVRYRRRPGHHASPIEGSLPLELVWTGVPLVIVLFVFVWGTRVFVRTQTSPLEAMRFHVTGKQWMWKIQHPTGQSEINALHVPLGQTIELTLISEDVIHSFYVPAFRLKKDALPGRYSTLWFQATRPGTYHLFCAEYCGTRHSGMVGTVTVMEPAAFQSWLSGGASGQSLAGAGQKLFQEMGCSTCHRADSQARGPNLDGVFGSTVQLEGGATLTADETYVRESIVTPSARVVAGYQPIMPTYQGLIGEESLMQLVAYIRSLNDKAGAAPAGHAAPAASPAPAAPARPATTGTGTERRP